MLLLIKVIFSQVSLKHYPDGSTICIYIVESKVIILKRKVSNSVSCMNVTWYILSKIWILIIIHTCSRSMYKHWCYLEQNEFYWI